MSVACFCVRDVDVVERDETVHIAAERMCDRNVGALVVVNEGREPIGMLTDRDLALRVVAAGKDPFSTTVAEVTTLHPATLNEDATLESALAVMSLGPCRRLPVVDHQGKLVGLLTLDDILSHFAARFAPIGELLRKEGPAQLARTAQIWGMRRVTA
jgi:CBS domain-containing protein